eukprot:1139599-Pelagomonas_calceolata.AAC.3
MSVLPRVESAKCLGRTGIKTLGLWASGKNAPNTFVSLVPANFNFPNFLYPPHFVCANALDFGFGAQNPAHNRKPAAATAAASRCYTPA